MFFSCYKCFRFFCKCFNKQYTEEQSPNEPEDSTQEELEKDYNGAEKDVLNDIQALQKYEIVLDSSFSPDLQKYTFRIFQGYIWLEKRNKNLYDPKNNISNGWKIHISLLDEDIPKAWPIIIQNLISKGVASFKISNTNDFLNKQPGKEGVIYYFASSSQIDWKYLLNSIEFDLRNAAVKPNAQPPKFRAKGSLVTLNIEEPPIRGSYYFYCTNDSRDEQEINNNPKDLGPFKEIEFNNNFQYSSSSNSII